MSAGSALAASLVTLVISCCGAHAQGAVPADPGATERNPVPGAEPDATVQSPLHGGRESTARKMGLSTWTRARAFANSCSAAIRTGAL